MVLNNHKYSSHLEKLNLKNECPVNIAKEEDTEAFRFCNKDIKDPDNFLPQAIKAINNNRPPIRRLTEDDFCDDYALSLFITEEFARKKFNSFTNRTKDLLGYTHLAKGNIVKTDGRNTPINIHGHFNLHEYMGVNLINRFIMVGKL